MQTPREIVQLWSAKLSTDSARYQAIDAVFQFVVSGPGGGTWRVSCREPLGVSEGAGSADCTIEIADADFVELANGIQNLQIAYLQGKIKVSGDMSVALRLSELM